jgi:hypothetical protein
MLAKLAVTKPAMSPTLKWRTPMKSFILAAIAALSLATAVAPTAYARSMIAGDAQATRMQQTGSYN